MTFPRSPAIRMTPPTECVSVEYAENMQYVFTNSPAIIQSRHNRSIRAILLSEGIQCIARGTAASDECWLGISLLSLPYLCLLCLFWFSLEPFLYSFQRLVVPWLWPSSSKPHQGWLRLSLGPKPLLPHLWSHLSHLHYQPGVWLHQHCWVPEQQS